MTEPPWASHSACVVLTQPSPLQEFLPAQSWLAVAHAPWPLHELTPEHLIISAAAEPAGPLAGEEAGEAPPELHANRPAAAAATKLPFIILVLVIVFLGSPLGCGA